MTVSPKRKPETADSLKGIRSQLVACINRDSDGGSRHVIITMRQARRIEAALFQFERMERILTEPSSFD